MGRKELNKYFVVDAFTDSAFKGNPAAVVLLKEERDEKWLQAVAAEFSVPMTCFLTPIITTHDSHNVITSNPRFHLRWFTPVAEVKLCGHATMAASHTLFTNDLVNSNVIEFVSLSGILTAKRLPEVKKIDGSSIQNDEANESCPIELNFPTVPTTEFNSDDVAQISKALNGASIVDIKRTTTGDDLFVVLPSSKDVTELQPQFEEMLRCPGRGIIVTAVAPPESEFDFYSRFFCPKFGINEDPVCGSACCAIAPYWSKILGKCDFIAYAASLRSGTLNIHLDEKNHRVLLQGKAVTVMEGSLLV